MLEKLKEPIAYEEAYRDVEKSYAALNDLSLDDSIAWYKATNETFRKFLKNLGLIILPAIKDSIIKKEHLEEAALAIYSLDPTKIDAVNKTLEEESTYKKSVVGLSEGVGHRLFKLFRTHNTLKHITVGISFFVGCAIFYYVAVNYLDIQKEYVFGASVAAFIGLLTIYSRRKSTQEFRVAL